MDKEQLKKMYYYVGPFIYKNKMVRIFRTKTTYSYVFYYDNKGQLELVNARDSLNLTKILTPDPKKIYNGAMAFGVEAVQPQRPATPPSKPHILQNPSEVEVQKPYEREQGFNVWARDDEGKVVGEISVNARHIPNPSKPSKPLTKEDIMAVKETLEKFSNFFGSNNTINKILNRINNISIIYDGKEGLAETTKLRALGYWEMSEKIIRILDSDKRDKAETDHTLAHELIHAFSTNGEKCGFDLGGGAYRAINEMFTEFLNGPKVDGSYSYNDYVNYLTSLFGKELPSESISAFFDNEPEKMVGVFAKELGVTEDDIRQFMFTLDAQLQIESHFNKGYKAENAKLLEAYKENTNNYITMFKLCQLRKNGEKINNQTLERIARETGKDVTSLVKGITESLITTVGEGSMSLKTKHELLIEMLTLNGQYKEVVFETIENYPNKNNFLFKGEEFSASGLKDVSQLNGDLATFFINSLGIDYQLNNIGNMQKLYDENAMQTLRLSVLRLNYENKQEKLISFYETNRDIYKNLIVDCLTGALAGGYNDMELFGALYGKLNDSEKQECITNACKLSVERNRYAPMQEEVLAPFALYIITNNTQLPNKECADMLFNTLTKYDASVTAETFEDLVQIYNGFEQDKNAIFEKAAMNMVGPEKYNQIKDQISPFIAENDYDSAYISIVEAKQEQINSLSVNGPYTYDIRDNEPNVVLR